MGDSIIFGIDQQHLSVKGRLVKVQSFPGATINDMYSYTKPLLKKPPIMSSYMLVPTTHQIAHQEVTVVLLINNLIFVQIVLFTRLENKKLKILIKPFQDRKTFHLHVIFLMRFLKFLTGFSSFT